MKLICFVFVNLFLICAIFCESKQLPRYIKKCNKSNFSECVLAQQETVIKNIIHGDKEYQIPNFLPFRIHELVIKNPSIQITLKNAKIYGFNTTKLISYVHNFDTNVVNLRLHIKQLIIDSDCKMTGRISILNIRGNGRLWEKINELDVKMVLLLNINTRNGLDYLEVKNITAQYSAEKIMTKVDNMFPNKDLNEQLNKILNENWKEFDEIINPSISAVLEQTATKILNGITKQTATKDIYDLN